MSCLHLPLEEKLSLLLGCLQLKQIAMVFINFSIFHHCPLYYIVFVVNFLLLSLYLNVSDLGLKMSPQDVQVVLVHQLFNMSTPWKGSLIFDLHLIALAHHETHIEEMLKGQPKHIEILDFIGKQPKFEKPYLSPSSYPDPLDVEWTDLYQPWVDLKRQSEVDALSFGNPIVDNGGGSRSKSNSTKQRFCSCAKCYHVHYKISWPTPFKYPTIKLHLYIIAKTPGLKKGKVVQNK